MTNKKQQTFGELMREYLKISGWTGAEVARRTGFSKTYIGNLLQDRAPSTKSGKPKRLPAETVDKIARALKIPLNEARLAAGLAPMLEPLPPPGKPLAPVSSEVEEMLLYYFRALPAERRPDALAIMARFYQDSIRLAAQQLIDESEIGQELEFIGRIGQG